MREYDENKAKAVDSMKMTIARAEKFEKLFNSEEFKEYTEMFLVRKKIRYENIRDRPPEIGTARYFRQEAKGRDGNIISVTQVPYIVTESHQRSFLTEWVTRINEIQLLIDAPKLLLRDAEIARGQLGKIEDKTEKTAVK